MHILKVFGLGLFSFLYLSTSLAAGKFNLEPGDVVLTNCHEIYTKGVIKAKVDEGYTVHFPKSSGPIRCPPFRWHAEFVIPFNSVPEYRLQFLGGFKRDLIFKVGETVTFRFEPDKRLIKSKSPVSIEARITDISGNGAIAVKLLSENPDAAVTFWQWVGENYVDLRHESLAWERDKRSSR